MSSNALYIEVPLALLSLNTVLASTACFIATVFAVGSWTHHYGPIPIAAQAIRRNNQIYAVVSIIMLALIIHFSIASYDKHGYVVDVRNHNFRGRQTTLIALAPFIYHCSKFYEYLDIILVLANHGPQYRALSQQPVGLHFGFHHLTTPYLTWFRIIRSSRAGWKVFAGPNCMHHAIMYSFFGGGLKIAGLVPATLRKALPWTGGLQLVAGIGMEARALMRDSSYVSAEVSENNLCGHWVALGLLSTYLLLYVRDLRQRAEEKPIITRKRG